jgi:hypothetical protein
MKTISLFLLLFIAATCNTVMAQYFYVKEIKPGKNALFVKENTTQVFKIMAKGDSTDLGAVTYPVLIRGGHCTQKDTIAMIAELLKYEGDTRICALPIVCYNPVVSQIYMRRRQQYSIQIEALFIINQLYFTKPFVYSPFPVLYNQNQGSLLCVNEREISDVYIAYKNWFDKIKALGIRKAGEQKITPLDSLPSIKWFP